jgi:Bacterial Ig-like domain (group 3)
MDITTPHYLLKSLTAPRSRSRRADGTTILGTAIVGVVNGSAQASFTTSGLALGSHAITAVYLGDSNNAGSTASTNQLVLQAGTATTIASSAGSATYGQSVTFTATVTPAVGSGTPTGTVSFLEGGVLLGTGALTGGIGSAQASFTTSTLDYGDDPIMAVYSGDTNYSSSSSDSFDQLIS